MLLLSTFSLLSSILLYLSLQETFQRFSFVRNLSQFILILSCHSHLKSLVLFFLLLLPMHLLVGILDHGPVFVDILKFILLFHEMIVVLPVNIIFLGLEFISIVELVVVFQLLLILLLFIKLTSVFSLS